MPIVSGASRPSSFVQLATRAGARGLLLDTADKSGPGLRGLIAPEVLARWVADAHDAGVFVALAGKLTADDVAFVRDAGADIAGVRGAACEGGRTGRISMSKVTLLRTLCGAGSACQRRPQHFHLIDRDNLRGDMRGEYAGEVHVHQRLA